MDLRYRLVSLLKVFLPKEIQIKSIQFEHLKLWERSFYFVALKSSIKGNDDLFFSGTGSGTGWNNAAIKALSEMGENIICFRDGGERSGLAGGFLEKMAQQRAYEELLERDAYLFHYRNQEPFLKCIYENDFLKSYLLKSRDSKFKIVLSLKKQTNYGDRLSPIGCIQFGLGIGLTTCNALNKSLSELAALMMYHRQNPKVCLETYNDIKANQKKFAEKKVSLMDIHHAFGWDPRNQRRFKDLEICKNFTEKKKRTSESLDFKKSKISFEKIKSPLLYIKYVRAYDSSHSLNHLFLGQHEHDYTEPLLQPFW